MPQIAHNGTARLTRTAGPRFPLCQCAQKTRPKALSYPFSPPATYPRNMHNGTFAPVSAAHDVPTNRTRLPHADRRPDGIPRPPGPSHSCLIEQKLYPGADGGPCTPNPSAGPTGPAPQAGPGPSGPDPAQVAKAGRARAGHGPKIRQQNTGTLRQSRHDGRAGTTAGKSIRPACHEPAARSGFLPVRTQPESRPRACTALGSSRPLRAGRVGVRAPRQAEP